MKQLAQSKELEYWIKEIDRYEKDFADFEKAGKKTIKRYKDEANEGGRSQFNILWSNTQTLAPALYAKPPRPNIERRFQDDDPVGLVTSRVLERCASYFVDTEDFDYSMKQVVLDNLLPGRGTAWVRYCPEFVATETEGQSPEGVSGEEYAEEKTITEDQEIDQDLKHEDVVVDYVHWEDFGHTCARTWEEVRGVWRCVYMTRDKFEERFPGKAGEVSFGERNEKDGNTSNKCCVYEIWDKETRKVIWVNKGAQDILDSQDDPLKLKGFFPCPKPLYATVANDNLIPVSYFKQYQYQAAELDELTARIESITKAIKVAGVYDSSAQGLSALLNGDAENRLIPVSSWAAHAEKGGLKGVIDFMPIQEIAQVLLQLYDARDRVKQDLYEITGISDIVRGATKANETATAQRIKGQFATLRLDAMQDDVARFSRDLVRIMTEIIAEHFSLDTIKQISGIKLLTDIEKQALQAQAGRSGVAGQLPPPPEEMVELLDKPTWEQVEQLIRSDMVRCFRISIETDSTIKADQEAEKQARIEFLTAVGAFMEKSVMLPPDLAPLAGEMLMFGVRGFKTGRELEQEMQATVEAIKKKSQQQQPDPAAAMAQMEAQRQQAEIEARQQESKVKSNLEMQKLDIERQRLDLERHKIDVDAQERDKDRKSKQNEALVNAGMPPDYSFNDDRAQFQTMMQQMQQNTQMMAEIVRTINDGQVAIVQGLNSLAQAQSAPKRVVRDGQGRAIGVETVQ